MGESDAAGGRPAGREEAAAGADAPRASWLAFAATVLYVLPATLTMALAAMVLSWVPPRGDLTAWVARIWARGILAAAGARVAVEVDPAVDPARGYVVISNHESYFDVLALLAVLPGTYRFVAKRSLFFIPLFGWALAAGGFIPVDRKNRRGARQIWKAAGDRLGRGASVLFYPEGTRSRDGRVHAFHSGAFLVALKTGAPILPVGVSGARAVMPRGTLRIAPGTIRVRFGAPVEVAGLSVSERGRLTEQVRRQVADLAGAELADAPAAP